MNDDIELDEWGDPIKPQITINIDCDTDCRITLEWPPDSEPNVALAFVKAGKGEITIGTGGKEVIK